MQSSAHPATRSPHSRPRLVCLFYSSRRRAVGDVHASRRVAAAALSHARGDFLHHPQAVRTRTRTEGRRQQSPCRFGEVSTRSLEPQRGFPRSTPNTPRTSPSLTHRHESVLRRTCGFWSAFVGPAAPTRRLLVQPSAHHATGSPHAQPRLMCLFYFSSLGRRRC